MAVKENNQLDRQKSDTVHDFIREGGWLTLLAGYATFDPSSFKSYLYNVYKGYTVSLMLCLIYTIWTGVLLSRHNMIAVLQGMHTNHVVLMCLTVVLCKKVRNKALQASITSLRQGVFQYGAEPSDSEHEEIKKHAVAEIRRLTRAFNSSFVVAIVANMLFVPIAQLVVGSEVPADTAFSPYLPFPFYMPFNTTHFLGFSAGYLINVLFVCIIFPLLTTVDHAHLSFTLQLKAQFKILNHSLLSLDERARKLIGCKNIDNSELFSKRQFQDSILFCLRSNIMHHQKLLRLNKTMGGFIGVVFFAVVTLASGVFASNILSVLQGPPVHQSICFISTLASEVLYTLHFCWFGEELSHESEEVFYSLYYTSWHRYDNRARKMISLMMCNCLEPVKFQTFAFGITASRHTFNSVVTTMYQLMNVIINSKLFH
nr:olfactory receptor 74 [Tropidothorax elegans]